jgi:carbon monoxide dehydrogenase subunit G
VELNNEFEVDRPIDQAWDVLTDVERIAPCLPGAQLQEIEGDEYRGIVKVKVGPITAQYKGKATFVEKDEAAKRAVLKAEGRDSRGQGNASALITAQLSEEGSGRTRVRVQTDLTVTGKVAQFGRGVMADVSEKLMGQFVDNLEAKVLGPEGSAASVAGAASGKPSSGLAGGPSRAPVAPSAAAVATEPGAVPTPGAPAGTTGTTTGAVASPGSSSPPPAAADPAPGSRGAPAASDPAWSSGAETGGSTGGAASPTIRKVEPVEPVEPVDLLGATGAPLAKRVLPVVGVILSLWLVLRLRRRRRR